MTSIPPQLGSFADRTTTRSILFGTGVFCLVLFVVFSEIVRRALLANFDLATTVTLQSHIPRMLDPFFSVFSLLGSLEMSLVVVALLFFAKAAGPEQSGPIFSTAVNFMRARASRLPMVFLFLLGGVIEVAGKTLLQHPGPSHQFARYALPFSFPTSSIETSSSYPSGHSFRVVFLSVVIVGFIMRSKRLQGHSRLWAALCVAAYTAVMLVSRVGLGDHWASDVIAGGLLGLALGCVSLGFL